jgi:hypothetical protein
MADCPHDRRVAAHIQSVSTRADSDTERLVSGMLRNCWPNGSFDRTEPGALEWLRRWGPQGIVQVLPVCSCPSGICHLCN